MKDDTFESIIGLEIHVELKTASKMFCGCHANWFSKPPNSNCCPVCLGLPGALPVPNRKAVEWCILLGLALNCEIAEFSKFDRKNYFYPDLPKGYQISQYDEPIARNGWLDIKSEIRNPKSETNSKFQIQNSKRIRIRRVHIEEDTGKLMHTTVNGEKCTLIDFNRSGVPLVEIVTEPDIRSSAEAKVFLKKLHQIIRYLGISDADMEKGSMRLEPNISVRVKGKGERVKGKKGVDSRLSNNDNNKILEVLPVYKVEVKNINSFSFAGKAIDFEIVRHIKLLNKGEIPKQETRGWDEKGGTTYPQRSKEEAHDYRYFPEPDIPPMHFSDEQIQQFSSHLPELPDMKKVRYINTFDLTEYDASILTDTKERAEYFEESVKRLASSVKNEEHKIAIKTIANWIINKRVDISKTTPQALISMIQKKQQTVHMVDDELLQVVRDTVGKNHKAVQDYRSGKENAIMYMVGEVMKVTKGNADSKKVKQKLIELLKN